jgi:predicted DNA-binding transcriptional regulator YafY
MGEMVPDLLSALETAFIQRQFIRFNYHGARGQKTQREVEPQGMLILPPLWYRAGWDPARGDFRHFRMDRIDALEALPGTHFRRRHIPFEEDVCPYSEMLNRSNIVIRRDRIRSLFGPYKRGRVFPIRTLLVIRKTPRRKTKIVWNSGPV